MSGFSPDWLALRAEADSRARAVSLEQALDAWLPEGPVNVVDLGSGTGANLRHLAPRLSRPQHWRLVDRDAGLLAIAARSAVPNGTTVETIEADLSDPAALPRLIPEGTTLVTCSALLDLAGEVWLRPLAAHIAKVRASLLAVLTWSGEETWLPAHADDNRVKTAFAADMRRDKGLCGPALAEAAAPALAHALAAHGYATRIAHSDWELKDDRDGALIAELATGTANALTPALGRAAGRWGMDRANAAQVTIGHTDLLALPPSR